MKAWQLTLLILVAVVTLVGTLGFISLRERLQPAEANGESTVFSIERGSSLGKVARELEADGLIRDARAFTALAEWKELSSKLRAGEYDVSPASAPQEILEHLTSGPTRSYAVVVPEGLRIHDVAQRLEEAGLANAPEFEAVARNSDFVRSLGIEADDLEGYLFPETYHLPRGLSAEEIARVFVEQFNEVWKEIELLRGDLKLSRHEIVTLASIVEKETGAAHERPRIAAVFLNRLRKRMRLETDPTVIFGIENFDGNLRRVHLEDGSNLYNTYRIRGLPPGPIASPGRAALRAIVEPDGSDYLFFVSMGDGTHFFSVRYADHEAAVDRYQRRRRR
jgi:UPF0755 protein